MPNVESTADKSQIGLTIAASTHLDRVMGTGWFEDRQDAYRLAVGVALAHGLRATDAEMVNAVTRYNFVGGIDKDGKVRAIISLLAPEEAHRPAAFAERLAHAGLRFLSEKLEDDTITLADLVAPVLMSSRVASTQATE